MRAYDSQNNTGTVVYGNQEIQTLNKESEDVRYNSVEKALDQADEQAKCSHQRLSHEQVFHEVKAVINGK